jgi:protein-serine/threonine kinase
MSSAALQTAPHQPTSVGSHSPIAATSSSRPYTAGSSQSRDGYYNQPPTNASPSSTRRPARRPSGNGASANSNPQTNQQYYSPSGSTSTSAAMTTRPHASSPVATTMSPTGYPVMAPGDHQRGVPPVVSPRTSSNRSTAHAASAAADRSRRTRYTSESTNSPQQATSGDGQQERVERQRSNGNTQTNGADRSIDDAALAAARARRRAQQSPGAIPHRPSGNRETRSQQSAAATQRSAAMGGTGTSSPSGPSREASEVLNRIIVSQPEVDIEREQERMAEAIPSSPTSQVTPRQLTVVPSEGIEDGGRGSRSRHDHTASSGKRERNSKFGEYYLGNTLGEGEFGKVKMGWKQEGGVQVS